MLRLEEDKTIKNRLYNIISKLQCIFLKFFLSRVRHVQIKNIIQDLKISFYYHPMG